MADKEKDEETTTEGGEKKKSNLLLIVIIGVLVLILIIGAVIAFLLIGNEEPAASSVAPAQQEASATSEDGENSVQRDSSLTEVGLMYPLDGFTVNLLSESGKRYLKVEMNLEIEGEELSPELDQKKPVFRDIIIRILSSKSLEEISTIKGKEKLKEQIVGDLNTRLKDGKVKNVYFTDFVVQ
ncbi:flagellar basal body-associated protein FliL [Sulfuricurvum sp.]|uniref:flagellar basal body-associated protein FliL n=1 Tax=Sulfuricurvum sp. TaxID=2025608 RepID=UPI0019A0A078|nr:flagellar basal body-associated protein FliL [Sulfuricurvum sp.]MBD3798357.1 flagellar basal body-associated protein FliL [Campylobacterota bacterium]MBD3805536.1 flagellar basal body-associated protein FliL [Sulfuricurvum sp.]